MCVYPKSEKKDSQVKQLFVLLGSVRVKAARKQVDEIDPSISAKKTVKERKGC